MFDHPPINIQGLPIPAGLNQQSQKLAVDSSLKGMVLQSAPSEICVAHAGTNCMNNPLAWPDMLVKAREVTE